MRASRSSPPTRSQRTTTRRVAPGGLRFRNSRIATAAGFDKPPRITEQSCLGADIDPLARTLRLSAPSRDCDTLSGRALLRVDALSADSWNCGLMTTPSANGSQKPPRFRSGWSCCRSRPSDPPGPLEVVDEAIERLTPDTHADGARAARATLTWSAATRRSSSASSSCPQARRRDPCAPARREAGSGDRDALG